MTDVVENSKGLDPQTADGQLAGQAASDEAQRHDQVVIAGWARVVALVGWVAALLISLYLLHAALTGGSLAGCSAESDGCNHVLSSKWSNIFGVPVSAFAIGVYILAISALWTKSRAYSQVLLVLLGMILGAGVWFIFVQAVWIGHYCFYCNTAHGLGAIGAIAVLLSIKNSRNTQPLSGTVNRPFSPLVFVVLGACVPVLSGSAGQEKSVLVTSLGAGASAGGVDSNAIRRPPGFDIDTGPGPERRVSILEGRIQFNPHHFPIHGSPDAKVVLFEFFDYTCPHCRVIWGMLHKAIERYPGQLSVVPLLTSLGKPCNDRAMDNPRYKDSCALGRLSIAVGRIDRAAWVKLDAFLMAGEKPPSVEDAQSFAETLVDKGRLESELKSPAIDSGIRSNLQIYRMIRDRLGRQVSLPILIYQGQVIIGYPGSEEAFFKLLEESYGLKPASDVVPVPDADPVTAEAAGDV